MKVQKINVAGYCSITCDGTMTSIIKILHDSDWIMMIYKRIVNLKFTI